VGTPWLYSIFKARNLRFYPVFQQLELRFNRSQKRSIISFGLGLKDYKSLKSGFAMKHHEEHRFCFLMGDFNPKIRNFLYFCKTSINA